MLLSTKCPVYPSQVAICLSYPRYRENRIFLSRYNHYSPHSKSENCECRKPGTALIIRACRDLNLDISMSYFVGDKTSDIEAGKRAGARTILVETGFGGDDKHFDVKPDYIAEDLLDAARYIKRSKENG